jgi:predicted CXXCH cytochrome family protein
MPRRSPRFSRDRHRRGGTTLKAVHGALWWGLVGLAGLLPWRALAAEATTAASPEIPATIQPGQSCVTSECHSDLAPGPGVHGPLNVGNCAICHETIDHRHDFRLARSGPDLCGLCHDLSLKSVVHQPVSDGNCTGCHDPHRSTIRPLLIQSPTEGLCMRCHDQDPILNQPHLHGPVEAGLCILCHEPHTSENLHLVREGGNSLCMYCHGDEFDEVRRMRHVHPPINDSCLACHDPHGGPTAALTHSPPPDICYTCHRDERQQITSSRIVHGAVTEDKSCDNCHAPHASSLPRLLLQNELEGCLGCHNRPLEAVGGGTIPDMATLIRTSTYLHGPVRDGNCTSCHHPHAGDIFRLLDLPYPPEFYAPFSTERYALCFRCHADDGFLTETTQTATNFRNGDENLHYLHVTKDERGRTCRACHEVHASNHPFHIRDAVPYGQWELPINFELLSDGGRCSPGCHEPRDYHRQAVEIRPLPQNTAASPETAAAE